MISPSTTFKPINSPDMALNTSLIKYNYNTVIVFIILSAIACYVAISSILNKNRKKKIGEEVEKRVDIELKKKKLESDRKKIEESKIKIKSKRTNLESLIKSLEDELTKLNCKSEKTDALNKEIEDTVKDLEIREKEIEASIESLENEKNQLEIEDVCLKEKCDPNTIIKISQEECSKLNSSAEIFEIDLSLFYAKGFRGNVFIHDKKGRETYSKLLVLLDKDHPFYGTNPNDLTYFDSTDEIFDRVKSRGKPVPGINNAIVIDKLNLDIITKKIESERKEIERQEFEKICEIATCKREHIMKLDPSNYMLLKRSLLKTKSNIRLKDFCVKGSSGNHFICTREGFKMYAICDAFIFKTYAFKRGIEFIKCVDSEDAAFDLVKSKGIRISNLKIDAVVIDKEELEKAEKQLAAEKLKAENKEFEEICKTITCNPNHIIKISQKEYQELNEVLKKAESSINLENSCKTGCAGNKFFYNSKGFKAYSIATILSGKHEHPLKYKDPESIIYVDSTDKIFEKVRSKGYPIPNVHVDAVVIDKAKFDVIQKQVNSEIRELTAIHNKATCRPKYILKLDQLEYTKLKTALKDTSIDLDKIFIKASTGDVFIQNRSAFEAYAIAKTLSAEHPNPLSSKKHYEIQYVDLTDPLFKRVGSKGYAIPGLKIDAVVMDKVRIMDELKQYAISKFGPGAEIHLLSQLEIDRLKNNKINSIKESTISKSKANHLQVVVPNISTDNRFEVVLKDMTICGELDLFPNHQMYYVAFKKGAFDRRTVQTLTLQDISQAYATKLELKNKK